MPNYNVFSDNNNEQPLKTNIYGNNNNVANVDTQGSLQVGPLTAFGDLRTAVIEPQVGWTFNYNINSDLISTTLTGSGTATTNNSKAVLQTGASAASSAMIQTIKALRYTPSLGGLIRMTAVFTTGVANNTQIIGLGDNADGFFFGYNGASFGILRRQNGIDNWIPQTTWNIDKFDGTGPSGVTLIPTNGNVYSIRFQWLGFGDILFNIENPNTGLPSLVHIIRYSNTSTNPSIFNPTLPLTAQVTNTTNTSNITLQTSSGMGLTEGNGNTPAVVTRHSFNNIKSGITTTQTSIFTLRNKTTYQGKTNRVRIQLDYISIQNTGTGGNNVVCRLVRNGTLGGAPVFTDISTNTSVMEADTAGTTVTGGTNLLTFGLNTTDSLQLVLSDLDIELEPGSTFNLTAFTTSSTSQVNISVSWRELF